ncbi:hypothetical protein KUV80_08130 [Fictibacillus nanhaiensis]|uniref:hypothetical protein n=1 Tax=Fictibacillus nanhaiensis TaxID=742169 RepID=UPI001C983E26|nr:hypothetical protein [Fictibacillus nanhaiensis]MBY6036617.1 hypothetical protein [Fictibacillus nanhaiensis]
MHYGKDNVNAGYHMANENYHMADNMQHHMKMCKENVGRYCEVEMTDGNVYQGKIHSYDNDNMYMIMGMSERDGESDRFFPGFGFGFGFPFFVRPFFPGFGLFGFPFRRFRRFRRFY